MNVVVVLFFLNSKIQNQSYIYQVHLNEQEADVIFDTIDINKTGYNFMVFFYIKDILRFLNNLILVSTANNAQIKAKHPKTDLLSTSNEYQDID